jgi:predicted nuclease of predicted toxin-antitoxin system
MSTSIRYFTDEHVPTVIANGLRKRGVDVLTVSEAGLLGTEDEDLLAFAREERRVIVTQDRDFLRLAAQAADHPGVTFASQDRSIGEMVRMLDLLAQVSNSEEMEGRVEYI